MDDFGIFVSGLMMGTLTFDLDDVVTKTTGGLIVLPRDHYLMSRDAVAAGDESHWQIGLRPMQLLHRILPALSAGLRSAAAQSDAQPGLHHDRRGHLESMVGTLLLVRDVHAVCVPRGFVSERGVRYGEARPVARRD